MATLKDLADKVRGLFQPQQMVSPIPQQRQSIVRQVIPQVARSIPGLNVMSQIQPTRQAIQSFGQRFPNVSRQILRAEQPVQRVSQFLQRPPTTNFLSQRASQIKAPVPRIAAQLGAGLGESFINALPQFVGGTTRTGLNLGRGVRGDKVTGRQFAEGIAPLAESFLTASTLGVGGAITKGAAKRAGTQTIKQAVKRGAIEGGAFGSGYGAIQGIQSGEGIDNTKDYVVNLLKETAIGGGSGAVLGGGLAGLGNVAGRLVNAFRKANPNASEAEVRKGVRQFIRDEAGRFAKQARGKNVKEPKFYGDLRAELGLPKYGEYDLPAGLQTGPIKQGVKEQLDYNSLIKQAQGEIGSQTKQKTSFKQEFRDFYRDWVNRFQPIEDVVSDIEKRTKAQIRPEFDPYYQIKRLLGTGGTAELRHKRELQPILNQLKQSNIDIKDFDVFLKAKRDIELSGRNIIGSDKKLAQERVQALSSKYDVRQLDKFANQLYQYQNQGLQKLKEAGFISDQTLKIISDANRNYVPFQRVLDQVDNYLGVPTVRGQQATSPVKKIRGSEKQILSPVESIIANTYKIEAAVAKNRVAQSIANLGQIDPSIGFRKTPFSGDNTISVWQNGKKVFYDVGTDIARMVKGLDEEQLSPVLKTLTVPASILRQGATGRNIDFMIPNIVKDQFDAAVNSKYGYRPFIDWFSGLTELVRYKSGKPSIVDDWMRYGGAQSFEMLGGRKTIQRQITEATKPKRLTQKLFSWLSEGIGTIGEYSEIPTRLGLFKRGIEKTKNPLLAIAESREGTLDFARMGAKMRVANSIIPFLNVGIQGFDRMVRSAKGNPAKFLFTMSAFGATPQIAVTAYNMMNNPEEYGEIEPYVKQDNFVIVTGRNEEGRPAYISIPKGNVIPYFTNPVDNFLTYLAGADRQSFLALVGDMLGEALPIVESGENPKQALSRTIGGVIPQAFKPALEGVANYNTFFGNEIVPWYMKSKPPPEQKWESTPAMYNYLGSVLNVSPLIVRNTLEGYLAGFAKTPAQVSDILIKTSKGEPILPDEIPILRRFFATGPTPEQTAKKKERAEDEKIASEENKPAPFLQRLFPIKKSEAAEKVLTSKQIEENLKDVKEDFKESGEKYREYENYVFYKSGDTTKTIDTSFQPEQVTLTGNETLDKKLVSQFNGEVTQKANDIYELYRLGLLTANEAEKQLNDLQKLKDSYKKPKSKKLTKLTLPKVTAPKIKISMPKKRVIQTLKIKSPPKPKTKKSKAVKTFKIAPIKTVKIKGLSNAKRLV